MKNECNIVRDLLPLYLENMTSSETKEFIEEHLSGCPECQKERETMQAPVPTDSDINAVPLKSLKRKLRMKRMQAVILTLALSAAVLFSAFAYLTAPEYFPYSEDLLTLHQQDDGNIVISFSDKVTGYDIYRMPSPEDNYVSYHISARSTTWDRRISGRTPQNHMLNISDNEQPLIYYSMNNGAEDVLLYGNSPYAGSVLLPRLYLGYYLILAFLAFLALLIGLRIFSKNEGVKVWIKRLLPFPVSYLLSHLCVKGLTLTSYSASRDFALIMLIALLIYLGCLSGMNLYRTRKENKQMS